ncbi:MAG: hypothetical protein RLZZ427_1541 [Pseudomonadota bacterium]|jgi:hypothetical protein
MITSFPLHYALSEALVAAAATLGIARLIPENRLGALGLLPFGLAGLIGIIQIAADLTGPIAGFHQFLSRSGAVFGLICLIGAVLPRRDWRPVGIGLAAGALVTALPATGMPLFGVLMLSGTICAYRTAPRATAPIAGAGFALLAGAQVIAASLRPTHPALAWHLFHIMVAAWLLIVASIILRLRKQEGLPA